MKKSLLLGTAFLVGVGAFAQTNRQALGVKMYPKARPNMHNETIFGESTQKLKASVNGVQSSNLFSNSRNGFGTLVEETNPVHYNQDLNMVAFIQRIPTVSTWPVTGLPGGGGVSGYMVTQYSTDNGTTWNGVCYMNNPDAWSRYPSGVIANAPGNTDPAQAKFVGVGPCTAASAGWPFNFFASVPANATGNVTTNDQQADSTAATAVSGNSQGTYFASYGTIANGTTVWTAAREIDANDAFEGVAVFKGVRGATVNDPYTWTVDHATFNGWATNSDGDYYAQAPKFAFAPDGMTGYVLINGIHTTSTGVAAKSMQPNVWKTTDAGATWTKVNHNYDWRASHPEILCNLIPTSHDGDWNGGIDETYPQFFDAHGGGITVDANGVLHYVTTVTPAYSSHPDSAFFIFGQYGFSYAQYDDLDKPWVYDFTTDGNGTWNQTVVGKLYTRNIETDDVVSSSGPAIWTTDGTAPMDYTNRIRCSRSTDGTKIFYTWTDGDTSTIITGTPNTYGANTFPNLEYRGYDLTSGMYSAQKEMSSFDAAEGGYYNCYTSTIAMPSASGYTIPAVYISSQDQGVNATNPVDYNYIYDMGIDNTEYTIALTPNTNIITDQANCVDVVGLKDVVGNEIKGVSQNYPNPFNANSVVKVNLNKSENITLTVVNNIGQVMTSTTVKGNAGDNYVTIDGTNLTNGIYFYTVTSGNAKVTRKMTVLK